MIKKIPTVFENFEDYWLRFSRGAGPTSTYYQQLDPIAQEKIKTMLSAMGVDYGQGYCIGKPGRFRDIQQSFEESA